MMHTFLFEPGIWTAAGTFWSDGRAMEVSGRTEVTHRPEGWLLSGTMHVSCSPPAEFVNVYTIEPPRPGEAILRWTSESSALGRLHGVFCAVGPSILSSYRSEQGGYHGVEHLAHVNAHHYEATGLLLMEERHVSSWRVALTREPLNVRR